MSSSAPKFTIFRFSLMFILVSLPFILYVFLRHFFLPRFCARLKLDCAFFCGNFLLLAQRAASLSSRRPIFTPSNVRWCWVKCDDFSSFTDCRLQSSAILMAKHNRQEKQETGNWAAVEIWFFAAERQNFQLAFLGQCIWCFSSGIVVRTCSNGKRIDAALEVQLKKW